MKESIPEITEAVSQLLEVTMANYSRGQLIAWPAIEAIAGSRREMRALTIIRKWRKVLLRDHEIVTYVAVAEGVRLLTHREAAEEVPLIRQRRAYRQVKRALKELATVDNSQLNVSQQRLLQSQRQHLREQRQALYRSQQEQRHGISTRMHLRIPPVH